MKRFKVLFLSVIAIALLCFSCCAGTPATSIKLDKTELQLSVGNEIVLVATKVGSGEIEFTSENEEIATVDNDGKVVAVKAGQTKIIVTESAGKKQAECLVTVIQPLSDIAFTETEKSIYLGDTYQTVLVFDPIDASNKNVTYSSEDLSVALVDSDGCITPISVGETTITATSEDGEKTSSIIVTVKQHVTGVELNVSSLSMVVDDDFTLISRVLPANASNKNVTYSSSCVEVATVDDSGNIQALSSGQTSITVSTEDGNKEATCLVNVIKKIESVSLDKSVLNLLKGSEYTFTATVLPSDAENKNVSYSSSNDSVVSVDEYGKISAIKTGNATITVTTEISSKTYSCSINVIETILPSILAVGQKVDFLDGYTYEVKEGNSIIVDSNKLLAQAVGQVTVNVRGPNGFDNDYDIEVIDLGITTGTTKDLAKDLTLWNYRNYSGDLEETISISLATKVGAILDKINTTTEFELDALKYTRDLNDGTTSRPITGNMIYLKPEIIASAIDLGYKYLSFYIYVPNDPDSDGTNSTQFYMYNCGEEGALHYEKSASDPILFAKNEGKWTRYNISLIDNEKLHKGAGFGWCSYGKYIYLAQVEFTGADISGYVSSYITASSTTGKSKDMISEELMGKMFVATCNTSTLSYGVGGGKETAFGGNDFIKLTKNGYLGTNYYTYNSIKISADWIQVAKKLGYNVIGIYILNIDGCLLQGTAGYIKQGVNGKCYAVNSMASNSGSQWTTTSGGFVSIDISEFNEGESLIIACSGASVGISGLTFRNYDGKNGITAPSLKYFNYDENMG